MLFLGIIDAVLQAHYLEASMKRLVLVGVLVGACAVTGFAQMKDKGTGQGHMAPKTQPGTTAAAMAPDGEMTLGSVHIPRASRPTGRLSQPAPTRCA